MAFLSPKVEGKSRGRKR
ncbi:hypothetical protein LINPERPRIM_LOCUS39744 [Linum perenne]